jgi:hypothetical protein
MQFYVCLLAMMSFSLALKAQFATPRIASKPLQAARGMAMEDLR